MSDYREISPKIAVVHLVSISLSLEDSRSNSIFWLQVPQKCLSVPLSLNSIVMTV